MKFPKTNLQISLDACWCKKKKLAAVIENALNNECNSGCC
jgi:hypothetical protein